MPSVGLHYRKKNKQKKPNPNGTIMLRQRGKDGWRVMHAEAKGSLPPGRLQRLTLTRAITLTSTVGGREQLLKKTTKHPLAFHSFTYGLDCLQERRGGTQGTPPLGQRRGHKTEKIPTAALQQGPK